MQEIPVFDEFGFRLSVPFKIPTWVLVILAFIIGGIISYLIFKPKEEKGNTLDSSDQTKVIA